VNIGHEITDCEGLRDRRLAVPAKVGRDGAASPIDRQHDVAPDLEIVTGSVEQQDVGSVPAVIANGKRS
jgi:hypothetical protein